MIDAGGLHIAIANATDALEAHDPHTDPRPDALHEEQARQAGEHEAGQTGERETERPVANASEPTGAPMPASKGRPAVQHVALAEALQILDRIESELPAIEQRTERLMMRYGLLHGEGKLTATAEVQKPQP